MDEGYSAPAGAGSKLQALQFFSIKADAAVVALLDGLQSTPVANAVQLINVTVFSIFTIAAAIKFFSFVYRAGASGDAEWDAVGTWATRVCVAMLLLAPIGTWTAGQLAVFYVAKLGSAFADRVAVAAGPAREALRPAARVGVNGQVVTAIPGVAPQAAQVVATVLGSVWCQQWLARTIGPQATVPPPTIETRPDGLRVFVFGAPTAYASSSSTVAVPRDVCGTIALPAGVTASSQPAVVLDPNGFGMPQFVVPTATATTSTIPNMILEAHRQALEKTVAQAAGVVSNFNFSANNGRLVSVKDDVEYVNEAPRIREALRKGAQALALDYTRIVMAAGGGTKTATAGRAASNLDASWGWIKYGLDFHERAANAATVAIALTWTPDATRPDLARMRPAPPTANYNLLDDELRAAGLLPAVPTATTSSSAVGSGDSISKFFDVTRLIALLGGFEDPSADPLEVAASVGPVLSAVGISAQAAYTLVSALAPGGATFVAMVTGTMIAFGQVLSIAVPAAPLLGWLMLVLGWFAGVISLAFTIIFVAFSLVRDDSPDLLSQSAMSVLSRIFSLLFTPALLVVGVTLITPILQLAWLMLAAGIMPVMRAAASGSVVTMLFASIFAVIYVATALVSIVYFSVSRITTLLNDAEKLAGEAVGKLGVGEKIEGNERVSSSTISGKTPRGGGAAGGSPAGAPSTPTAGSVDSSKNVAAQVPASKA